MSPAHRLDEVAAILALGIRRLLAREAAEIGGKHRNMAETDLDFRRPESVSDLEPADDGDAR